MALCAIWASSSWTGIALSQLRAIGIRRLMQGNRMRFFRRAAAILADSVRLHRKAERPEHSETRHSLFTKHPRSV